jgi:cathepsin L
MHTKPLLLLGLLLVGTSAASSPSGHYAGSTSILGQKLNANRREWPLDPNFSVPNTTAWLVDPPNTTYDVLDSSIDWRKKGAVTRPKSQCGGTCWSFSATGNMEGAWGAAGNSLISLSEQYLQDGCAAGSTGPYGLPVRGDPNTDGKVASEAQYPTYTGTDPTCGHKQCAPTQYTLQADNVQCLPNGGAESNILNLLQSGPVGISIGASGFSGSRSKNVSSYSTGILGRDGGFCDTAKLDHAVLIVGFGTDTDGTQYWIMKNSWGTGFGENGFWRMKYGVNCMGLTGGGPCQVKSISSIPLPSQCADTECRNPDGTCPAGKHGVACSGPCSARCGGGVMGCGCAG